MSFERHTRRKIKNHPSEVDTDALWNSIKDEIPQERKKKRGIFFFFLGIGIVGSVIVFGLYPIPQEYMMGSAITALDSGLPNPEKTQENNSHLSDMERTGILDGGNSESDAEIFSRRHENLVIKEEFPEGESPAAIADAKVVQVAFNNPAVAYPPRPAAEITNEILTWVTKEKDDYFPLAENIQNPKNILVKEREMDEELAFAIELPKEEIEEEEEEKRKKEKKKKKKKKIQKKKPSYAAFAQTSISTSLKGQTIGDIPVDSGVNNGKTTHNLIKVSLGMAKNFSNNFQLSSEISHGVLSEKVNFKAVKYGVSIPNPIIYNDSLSQSDIRSINNELEHEIMLLIGSDVDNTNLDENGDGNGDGNGTINVNGDIFIPQTDSIIASGNYINLEAVNKTRYFGFALSLAYEYQFKNEQVSLVIGAGVNVNLATSSSEFKSVSGTKNEFSKGFISSRNAVSQKKLTASSIVSAALNLELSPKADLILSLQYQANPSVLGIGIGMVHQLGSK